MVHYLMLHVVLLSYYMDHNYHLTNLDDVEHQLTHKQRREEKRGESTKGEDKSNKEQHSDIHGDYRMKLHI